MKNLIRTSVAALFVLTLMSISLAQPMRMSAEDRAKALKDSLKLNDEQTTKVTVIFKEQQNAMRELMQSGGDDREAMRATMMEQAKTYDAKIDSLLTAPQKQKYNEMKKNRMSMRGRMRGGN